jgi:hypothetical protein
VKARHLPVVHSDFDGIRGPEDKLVPYRCSNTIYDHGWTKTKCKSIDAKSDCDARLNICPIDQGHRNEHDDAAKSHLSMLANLRLVTGI